MVLPPPGADAASPGDAAVTAADRLAALRAAGAPQADPVRWQRLERLALQAAQHHGPLAEVLGRCFERALADCHAAFGRAHAAADAAIGPLRERFPQAARQLDELHARGDFDALGRLARRLGAAADRDALLAPLRGLCERLVTPAAASGPDRMSAAVPELKALRASRAVWARLSVDRQLSRSLQKTPDNPGPLNSHSLVLRALQQMDAIAPGYLERFVSQVETLMWLDQATGSSPATVTPARGAPRDATAPARAAAPKRAVARRRAR